MATNDSLLLDGLIDDLLEKEQSSDRGRVFEFFVLGQLLKEWDLSIDELESGWTDGRQDGGIDGFYVLVNGHCITDISEFSWPRVSAHIFVHIVTCKHADSFNQAALDALIASLTELLDLSIDDRDLKGAYSKTLLTCRARLLVAYRKLAPRLASFAVKVSYASRGNRNVGIGVEVQSRADQILALVQSCFHSAETAFEFVGATELIELHRRRPRFSLDLPYVASLSSSGSNYILLVNLEDYFRFCRDDEGKLRRYLFDSNVRDFMGLNRVNEDIASTLGSRNDTDFWWLNNGVTILATSAWSTGNRLHMENVQIVNGLQTTETIFRHFTERQHPSGRSTLDINEGRAVMVKVISSVDAETRDQIIRATNNQTSVEQISLHATDKVQRDIEEALIRRGLHYERRKNFYINQGVAASSIVTPMYLASGALALGRRREPWSAVALRQRHLRYGGLYDELFSEKTNLRLWGPIATILKAVDGVLENERPARASEGFLKKTRYLVALIALGRNFGTFNYSDADLLSLECDSAFSALVRSSLALIPASPGRTGKKKHDDFEICERAAHQYGITHIERIRGAKSAVRGRRSGAASRRGALDIPDSLVENVFAVLPPQPWKPGTHVDIALLVGCSVQEYFAAVERLTVSGRVLRQKDGVVYAQDGSVAGFDPERVTIGEDGSYTLIT